MGGGENPWKGPYKPKAEKLADVKAQNIEEPRRPGYPQEFDGGVYNWLRKAPSYQRNGS
jgi:hypothetical protein